MKITPFLTIIAGCNGAGKSSFANAITSNGTKSFDYDKVFLEYYNSLLESELKDRMAHNLAWNELESQVARSINEKCDFAYETNFHDSPLFWPEKFKSNGFKLRLVFFCLNSLEEAKRRVQIRVENGGHFVPEDEIKNRYFKGFENVNDNWEFFDELYFFDTSAYKVSPSFMFSLVGGKLDQYEKFPDYLVHLLPNIYDFIQREK